MNDRERFNRTLSYKPVDHCVNYELALWGQTLDRWRREGLPEDVYIGTLLAGCEYWDMVRIGYVPLQILQMMPAFEEEVLEEDERYMVKRWPDGHVSRLLKEGMAHGTRASMDQMLSFPVTDRASFESIVDRYNPHSPARYPEWWPDVCRCLQGRDYPLMLTHNACFGLYSFMRRLMGTELACTIFYDDPALAHEILDYLTEYFIQVTRRALQDVEVDFFNYFEDFCYNAGPLVSPKLFRAFLMPRYRRINEFLRGHGVRHIWLDSDGNTELLIPMFIEMGITCHWPLERAAGMDPLVLRATYGHDLALVGGIDKRELAKGRTEIEAEVYRLRPLMEDGGFVPTVDHAVPPDVPYDNWLYYLEVKRKLLGM
jgi:uroporphyrinogen decarboxylase